MMVVLVNVGQASLMRWVNDEEGERVGVGEEGERVGIDWYSPEGSMPQ